MHQHMGEREREVCAHVRTLVRLDMGRGYSGWAVTAGEWGEW